MLPCTMPADTGHRDAITVTARPSAQFIVSRRPVRIASMRCHRILSRHRGAAGAHRPRAIKALSCAIQALSCVSLPAASFAAGATHAGR
jgi:hypothetical protein